MVANGVSTDVRARAVAAATRLFAAQGFDAGKRAGAHFADVDAEAYVVHVMQLVITAAASATVMAPLLDGDRARYDRELARIARSSLFAFDRRAATRAARPPRPARRPRKSKAPAR